MRSFQRDIEKHEKEVEREEKTKRERERKLQEDMQKQLTKTLKIQRERFLGPKEVPKEVINNFNGITEEERSERYLRTANGRKEDYKHPIYVLKSEIRVPQVKSKIVLPQANNNIPDGRENRDRN